MTLSTSFDPSAVLSADPSSKLPAIEVTLPTDPDHVCLGNLLLVESNTRDENVGKSEKALKKIARENAQLLLNDLWRLPTHKQEEVVVAALPPPSTDIQIPREKPLPKPKPPTKWEKFAAEKGIVKKKKTKLVWDEVVNRWVPRFGYGKAKAEHEKNWLMEIKDNANPTEDPREKAAEDKRERVAKNELQRLRNVARSKKVKVPSVGITAAAGEQQSMDELKRAADFAKKSTASLGKFQQRLPGQLEKVDAKKGSTGRKRKFEPLVNAGEKEKSLKILEQISNKAPKLDMTKAVGKEIFKEEQEAKSNKAGGAKGKKGKGVGKKGGGGKGRKGGPGFKTGKKGGKGGAGSNRGRAKGGKR